MANDRRTQPKSHLELHRQRHLFWRQILAEQAGFATVALTETHVDHCEIPNAYFGPWLHRIGPREDEQRVWD